MPDVRLIDRPEDFQALLREIAGTDRLAIDTEAASFHRYYDRIYLIQLSVSDQTVVIDPLGVGDLGAIGELLADPAVEKIFHDADYDLRLFHKQYGYTSLNLFDTRVAAQLLGEPGIGLGALLQKYYGLSPDKRFQRADWSVRPLSQGMLEYAAGDTSHLHQLREQLRSDLVAKGRIEWAEEEFLLTQQIRSAPPPEEGEGFFRLKGAKALDRRAMAILRELYEWREATAASLDRASFRVMGNDVLFALAEKPVTTIAELGQVRGIGRDVAERRGGQVVAAITKALELPDDQLPKVVRPPRRAPDLEYEARVDALKKVRNALAEEYGLQPGVLCPNGILEGIARELPRDAESLARVPGIRQWQVREFGDRLIATLPESGPTE